MIDLCPWSKCMQICSDSNWIWCPFFSVLPLYTRSQNFTLWDCAYFLLTQGLHSCLKLSCLHIDISYTVHWYGKHLFLNTAEVAIKAWHMWMCLSCSTYCFPESVGDERKCHMECWRVLSTMSFVGNIEGRRKFPLRFHMFLVLDFVHFLIYNISVGYF